MGGCARDRFDPPLLRHAHVVARDLVAEDFVRDLAERSAAAGWSTQHVEGALWHGGVQLDGRPIEPGVLPPTIAAGTWVRAWAFVREPELPALDDAMLLHVGARIVALAKPAGWPVQGTRASGRISLERWLRERLDCPALVAAHRLDRETSGVVLFARDRDSAAWLGRAFATGAVEKTYLARVRPAPAADAWSVSGWMAPASGGPRYRQALFAEAAPGRRESRSTFRVLARAADGREALVEARPFTGRTHQLRVHLAASGAPIAGDPIYGDPTSAPRLQLHASRLTLRAEGRGLQRDGGSSGTVLDFRAAGGLEFVSQEVA